MAAVRPVQILNPVIPPGSRILVTGVNGYIGSHVANQLLLAGYKVRGTVRSLSRTSWLDQAFAKYGKDQFARVEIPRLTMTPDLDKALEDVSGVAHVATDTSFMASDGSATDVDKVVRTSVQGTKCVVEASNKKPVIRRVVVTSSCLAALLPVANDPSVVITETMWNQESVDAAYKLPADNSQKAFLTYAASKTLAERWLWEFVDSEKPHFEVNTVLPALTIGRVIDPPRQGAPSTAGWITAMFNGEPGDLAESPPHFYIDVEDVARLHVNGLLMPSLIGKRIFAFADTYDYNQILGVMQKHYPDRRYPPRTENNARELSRCPPREKAEQILKDAGKLEGFTSLEESVLGICESALQKT